MPLYRVQVRKAYIGAAQAFKWSNIYYVNAASVTSAANTGVGYWNRERVFHDTLSYAYEVYASDLLPNTSTFVTVPIPAINSSGQLTQVGELYHPGVVVRVDLGVVDSRPSRKFFRLPLYEGSVGNGNSLLATVADAIADGMDLLLGLGSQAPVDESGNPFTGFVIEGITMRRLGRDARHDVPPHPGS